MSNEIAVPKSQFPILDTSSEAYEAMTSASEFGSLRISDLPRVGMPTGGGKAWSWVDGDGNDQTAKTITGLLVGVGRRGTLWPTTELSKDSKPLIVSNDLKTGLIVGSDYGDLDRKAIDACRIEGTDNLVNWQELPYAKFGSAGRGKRCKESRVLFVLQPDQVIPLAIQASAGSIAAIDGYLRKTSLSRKYWQCIVEVGLEQAENLGGQPYSRVTMKTVGTISKEEGEVIRRLYVEPLTGTGKPAEAGEEVVPF